ncbi:transmembrane protein [Hydrogenophaga taeniospiralis CCUG 15921]|uniref:Transmembrane protein n=1 Tax=Hydrogenophaga taeniospiralis CCUG 15921 TaxID=1281780 RepID=A0A9X4NU06_9BURK|nr:hypothetical protein [Hydrogenophaga taeniospiralis]MDG5976601.1 transmembrane protein [Hydrogenophaga taeniospiralis CCUG 15921]
MSDIVDMEAVDSEKAQSLKSVGWLSYILHLIVAVAAVVPGAQVGAGLLLVALVIDLVKQGDAEGTWQVSHFRWRIRTVIWAGVLYVVTLPLWFLLLLPGMIAWVVISIWFLYRIVKGMVRMNANQPMPD